VCAGEVLLEDATEEARKLLSAAVRTGERFGAHHLADIVTGTSTDKVLERGHQKLPTFGAGADRPRPYWLSLAQDLAGAGYLARGEERTSGFRLTELGRLLLAGKDSFRAPRRPEQPERGAAGNRRAAEGEEPGLLPAGAQADAEGLFQCLKRLRLRLARARDVPPYVVFSDKSLRAIAAAQPTTAAAFLRCPGVGERKLEAFGEEFLRAVRGYLDSGGCPED
jgi:ATP-dependent DNA helicase RecQ